MNALRHAAAGIVGAAAVVLLAAAVLAVAVTGLDWVAGVYLGGALALFQGARRLRPRRRFVFARR